MWTFGVGQEHAADSGQYPVEHISVHVASARMLRDYLVDVYARMSLHGLQHVDGIGKRWPDHGEVPVHKERVIVLHQGVVWSDVQVHHPLVPLGCLTQQSFQARQLLQLPGNPIRKVADAGFSHQLYRAMWTATGRRTH